MHPQTDESLSAFLSGRLSGADREAVSAHLGDCASCAARASALASWGEDLAGAFGEERAFPEALRRMRLAAVPPGDPARAPVWRWGLAAAGLLLAAGVLLKLQDAPKPPLVPAAAPHPTPNLADVPRLAAEGPGLQLLAGPGSRLQARGADGWVLSKGSCLLSVHQRPVTIDVGGVMVRLADGELVARAGAESQRAGLWMSEALADEAGAAEVAVLFGKAELESPSRREVLAAGEAAEVQGGSWIRRRLGPAELSARRGQALGVPGMLARGRGVGDARLAEGEAVLDGKRGMAGWQVPAPGADYLVSMTLTLEAGAKAGLSFEVDGLPTLWIPEGGTSSPLADGRSHVLGAVLSSDWVTLSVDGLPGHRVPRAGFKPNPLVGVSGVGLLVWDGKARLEAFDLAGLP